MKSNKLSREVQVDPYWHEKLLPSETFLPDSAIFIAEASVWYKAIGATETYWLQDDSADHQKCSLWCQYCYKSGDWREKGLK